MNHHIENIGKKMEFSVSCPGKVILHGEHSVVYGRTAIACSISKLRTRVDVVVTPGSATSLSVKLPDLLSCKHYSWSASDLSYLVKDLNFEDKSKEMSSELLSRLLGTYTEEERGIVSLLFLYFSIILPPHSTTKKSSKRALQSLGIELILTSSIPIGAGLGSSAAYNVSLSAAFHLIKARLSRKNGGLWYYKKSFNAMELESICQNAFLGECFMHGKASGIDNSICTYGGHLSFKTGKAVPFSLKSKLRILLVDTKVSRNTKALVGTVREKVALLPKVTASILEAMERVSVESLENLKKMDHSDDKFKIYRKLEELISINHELLCAFGVSHPSLNKIVDSANAYGISAKMTGAGGGGFALALLTPFSDNERIERLKEELVNCGFECWESEVGGEGVCIES
ncbi:mevalonate kinase isoform X1 [Lepeophtheirus salmonis]|uniref:mevalonate kinase isoform X1 n=2 Tax=Lepeophtheirus salmonis TaxID=72036 RepID=UPI001AE8D4EE|nr:mevalonate kinase-like isoform X1 [Lepeophtheirus salmonis]